MLLENPIVENSAIKRGGREITKISVIISVIDTSSRKPYSVTNQPIRFPLAPIVKRQAAKAVRNLPPKSPSRGPVGLITRQTPNSSNLRRKYRVIFDNLRQELTRYRLVLSLLRLLKASM